MNAVLDHVAFKVRVAVVVSFQLLKKLVDFFAIIIVQIHANDFVCFRRYNQQHMET